MSEPQMSDARRQIIQAMAMGELQRQMQSGEDPFSGGPDKVVGHEPGDIYSSTPPRERSLFGRIVDRFSPRNPLHAQAVDDGLMDGLRVDSSGNRGEARHVELRPGALAEDLSRVAKSFGAGLADPFDVPSAITGHFSPETRDAWREAKSDIPTAGLTGGMVGSGAVMAPVAGASLPIQIASGATGGAASDVIDAAAGHGQLGRNTAFKALAGGIAPLPFKTQALIAGTAIGASGASDAFAADPGGSGKANPYADLDAQIAAAEGKLQAHDEAKRTASGGLAAEWQRKGLGPAARKDAQAQFDAEWSGRAKPINDDIGRLRQSRTEVMGRVAGDEAEARRVAAAQEAARGEQSKRNNTPVRELYPAETMAAQAATFLAGLAGTAITKRANVNQYNTQVQNAERAAQSAATAGRMKYETGDHTGATQSLAEAKAAQQVLDNMIATGPSNKGVLLPAIAGTDAAFLGPQLVDRYLRASPGSDLYEKSDPVKSWDDFAKRLAGAAIVGGGLGKGVAAVTGAKTMAPMPIGSQGIINGLESRINGRAMIDADMMKRTQLSGDAGRDAVLTARQRSDDVRAADRRDASHSGQLAAERNRLELEAAKAMKGKSVQGPVAEALQQAIAKRLGVTLPPKPQQTPHPQSDPPLPPPDSSGQKSLPPPATGQGEFVIPPGIRGTDSWAAQSERARAATLDHLDGGGNLATPRGATSDPRVLTAPRLHDQLDTPSFGVSSTQSAMKRLRDVLVANGIDPKTVTRQQAEAIFGKLDPKIFGVAGLGAGMGALGSGQSEHRPTVQDELTKALYLRELSGQGM